MKRLGRTAHILLSSDRLRRLYQRLRAVPYLGLGLRRAVTALFPRGSMKWITIRGGAAAGMKLLIDPRFEPGYLTRLHEPITQDLFQSLLRDGMVLYDVGAHIGFLSLCASPIVGAKGAIFAFEPDPDNFARLVMNIEANGLSNIHAANAAVWSKAIPLQFSRASSASARVEGRVSGEGGTRVETISVQGTTLDTWAEQNVPPDFVKVDVEGGEVEVLRGSGKLLQSGKALWLIELHDEKSGKIIEELLSQAGYQTSVVSTEPGTPRRHILARHLQSQ